MKVIIFTQDEKVYLPIPIGMVVDELGADVSAIVLCPPMSTHGGRWKGLRKHLGVFGVKGAAIMAWRIASATVLPAIGLRPRGRKYWTIEEIAARNGIPIFRVKSLKSSRMTEILGRHPADLLISVSCPQIISADLLGRFRFGGVNAHSGDLPKYRGLMPGFWTLYHKEPQTAVTVHFLANKLDDGEILLKERLDVGEDDTWDSLIRRTKTVAGRLLLDVIRQCEQGTLRPQPNPDAESTYFSFPTANDARVFRARGNRMF